MAQALSTAGMSTARTAFIQGLPISMVEAGDVLAEMGRVIERGDTGRYISITNTETMYHGLHDRHMGEYVRSADFSLCDGVGIIAAGLAWGHRIHRLTGPILQLEASAYGVSRGWRHFFYGGKEGVADRMAERLARKYPGLDVCGTYCPPFRALEPHEDEAIVQTINAARPDIVWVGLGLPKQERWIAAHLGRVRAPWMIGVGAAFDYHSGDVPWAPPMFRALGMEWMFRLAREPRMRSKRYWRSFKYVVEAAATGVATGQFLRRSS